MAKSELTSRCFQYLLFFRPVYCHQRIYHQQTNIDSRCALCSDSSNCQKTQIPKYVTIGDNTILAKAWLMIFTYGMANDLNLYIYTVIFRVMVHIGIVLCWISHLCHCTFAYLCQCICISAYLCQCICIIGPLDFVLRNLIFVSMHLHICISMSLHMTNPIEYCDECWRLSVLLL